MRSKEHVSTLSAPILQNTLQHQQQPKARMRYEPLAVYYMAEQAKAGGVDLEQAEGPWRAGVRAINRPGRKSLDKIPLVTNEHTEVMVDTMEHASDVAGLLNWCGVRDLDPVTELLPPQTVAP
jgi:hypothetical protein